MYRKYTKENLEPIIKECTSFNQVLKKLNKKLTGGNQTHIRSLVKKFNISVTHFTGQGWSKGKTLKRRDIKDYLKNGGPYITSSKLRKRLISEHYFDYKCYVCNRKNWNGAPIPLELHHKDHNHENNELTNLNILCPNCHAISH